jgi:hypothetical protein
MTQQPQDETNVQLTRLRGMLKAQRIRLEVQKAASTPDTSSVIRWERLIRATELEIQRLESYSPLASVWGECDDTNSL